MKRTTLNFFFASSRPGVKFTSHARTRNGKAFILLLCAMLTACQQQQQPAPQGKRYELKGTVVSVDKAGQSATISHEEVKDFMDAMTMPFKLKDAWPLDVMKPGDAVQATLVVTDDSHWLEDVVVVQKSAAQTGATPPESSQLPQPGDSVPDFRLVNQDGKSVRLKQYEGKAVLLTFIYTRCPVPEYCALMSSNFAEIERALQRDDALYKRTHLLSVSFDPAYDTPKVLRSYGAAQTGKYDKETFKHWEFVTGDAEEVKRVAQFFGLTYIPEKGEFVHSLQTALIAPDGTVVKLYSGNEWKPEEILSDTRRLLDKIRQ
jgi:protein SCO1